MQVVPIIYSLEKKSFAGATFKVCEPFFFADRVRKPLGILWSV